MSGATATPGLVLAATDPIRSFLSSAAASADLAADLRDLASALASEPSVPYRSIRAIWCADSSPDRPPLRQLLRDAQFVLLSPKPREKSDELKARLEKLREMQERKEYADLVRDVAPKEDNSEPFSSYKDQLGFGLHVVVIMFTGYLVGFAAFRALFSNSPVMNAAGGILGVVGGMLMETVLFIIRSSSRDLSSSPAPRSKKLQ
ncbi:uncharacterized protein LOC100838611 [Brachypodium distachyon]|uniref:ATPase, vacuolar ER assembly factor, Vma12 n=1 Tax=Brachypodium distachyon TaxID=15368 RepID=I1I6G9_BRADI|nr:uncharacterized protein LOC100838611 [Brachypodium distachyon]KQJ97959.1 hypothetical protein BRADI_3g34310v3 [Brachypodium distachyon]|eukprot:XP_003574388.1 uncharacterized protein LOC100838611 [Brachypodium distachyon]